MPHISPEKAREAFAPYMQDLKAGIREVEQYQKDHPGAPLKEVAGKAGRLTSAIEKAADAMRQP